MGFGSANHTPVALARVRSVLATSTLMARTAGGLFLIGGFLAAVVTAQTSAEPVDRAIGYGNVYVVYGAVVVAVIVGVSLLLWGNRLRPWHHQVLVALGTVLITVAIHESPSAIAALSLASLYVFVACDSAFFFTWPQAVAQFAFAIICLHDGVGAAPRIALVVGADRVGRNHGSWNRRWRLGQAGF